MYPPDAVTIYSELVGAATTVLLPNDGSTKTVLGFSMRESGAASTISIKCGAARIATNEAQNMIAFNAVNFRCADSVTITKTGADNAAWTITYVPYDTASTSPAYPLNASSTAITYHDWLFMNMWILFLLSFIVLGLWFSPMKKNKATF